MNLGTAITLLIVSIALFAALQSIVRDWRRGTSKCSECGGGCRKSACASCSTVDQMVKNLDNQTK